jgi:hypothetical protein
MLVENALFAAVLDMALLVPGSGLYRLMAKRMRGYDDAQARQIFCDLIDMTADVAITSYAGRVQAGPPSNVGQCPFQIDQNFTRPA